MKSILAASAATAASLLLASQVTAEQSFAEFDPSIVAPDEVWKAASPDLNSHKANQEVRSSGKSCGRIGTFDFVCHHLSAPCCGPDGTCGFDAEHCEQACQPEFSGAGACRALDRDLYRQDFFEIFSDEDYKQAVHDFVGSADYEIQVSPIAEKVSTPTISVDEHASPVTLDAEATGYVEINTTADPRFNPEDFIKEVEVDVNDVEEMIATVEQFATVAEHDYSEISTIVSDIVETAKSVFDIASSDLSSAMKSNSTITIHIVPTSSPATSTTYSGSSAQSVMSSTIQSTPVSPTTVVVPATAASTSTTVNATLASSISTSATSSVSSLSKTVSSTATSALSAAFSKVSSATSAVAQTASEYYENMQDLASSHFIPTQSTVSVVSTTTETSPTGVPTLLPNTEDGTMHILPIENLAAQRRTPGVVWEDSTSGTFHHCCPAGKGCALVPFTITQDESGEAKTVYGSTTYTDIVLPHTEVSIATKVTVTIPTDEVTSSTAEPCLIDDEQVRANVNQDSSKDGQLRPMSANPNVQIEGENQTLAADNDVNNSTVVDKVSETVISV